MMVEMKAIGRIRHIPLLRFQKIIGKLRYAALGIPSGKGLFTPLHDALRTGSEKIIVTKLLRHSFRDWRTLLRLATKDPVRVKQLVAKTPHCIGECDACGCGLVEYGYRGLV